MDESIYKLIVPEKPKILKEARYKSKFPPIITPTGSTLCLKTTSI